MSLSMKQQEFTRAIGMLILFADSLGYGLTFGDAYAGGKHGHMNNSNHYNRLAVDLNLFVEGVYIDNGEDHVWTILHDYWENIGGGRMIKNDANHFSFKHNGVL